MPGSCAMPRIDEVEKAEPTRSTRSLQKRNTDKEVKKAINDNLKGMSNTELHGTQDNEGYTCYQKIAQRRRLNRENPTQYPCGGTFYKDVRTIQCCTMAPAAISLCYHENKWDNERKAEREDYELERGVSVLSFE